MTKNDHWVHVLIAGSTLLLGLWADENGYRKEFLMVLAVIGLILLTSIIVNRWRTW